MKKNISAKHQKFERQRLATIMLISGVVLVIISAVLSVLFIRPTDFKAEYRKRQLSDCLQTTTNPVSCQEKFGEQ